MEGEHLPLEGKSRVQDMRRYEGNWRGNEHLLWDGVIGESMSTSLDMPRAGRFKMKLVLTLAPDYGVFNISLNGKLVREGVDLFGPKVAVASVLELGEVALDRGPQRVVFKLIGANPKARKFKGKGYLMGLDYIELIDLDDPGKDIVIARAASPEPVKKKVTPAATPSGKMPELKALQPLLAQHCHTCHGKDKTKGKVDLVKLTDNKTLLSHPALLEEMVSAVRDFDMPPEDEVEMPKKDRDRLLQELGALRDYAIATQPFAATPIRRMNRFQYNNAVVDLFELDRDIFSLPERLMRRRMDYFHPERYQMPAEVKVSNRPLGKDVDGQRPEGFRGVAAFPQDRRAEHGYDNRGDHLTLSPLLMEAFLTLSRTIVESKDFNARECRSWERLFKAPPVGGELDAIRERLPSLLRKAWRRPVDAPTVDRYLAFAEKELAAGREFTSTMKMLMSAVIASPDFIYLYAAKTKGDGASVVRREPCDGFELATRLSFFLWSGLPDEELLNLAEEGRLTDPRTLEMQIDRMLNDKRVSRFCDVFPGQWLQLDRLITAIPDREQFKYFYFQTGYRASMHMMMEPLLLFETVYLENRSILDLIDPIFTWSNEVIDSCYRGGEKMGRQDLKILTLRRVPVTNRRYGGLITNAAVLTMTSAPDHTLPINRGAWVNTVIFNDPPDPPPADVPPLPKPEEGALENLTIRERFAEHRKREDCAGCHRQIDPLGFALENYGPTGVWRDVYKNDRKVDVSGQLFGEHRFNTALEFKQAILDNRERYFRGFAAHLMSYGLGRALNPADTPALGEISSRAMQGDDRMRSFLKMVAMSEPFRHKNTYSAKR